MSSELIIKQSSGENLAITSDNLLCIEDEVNKISEDQYVGRYGFFGSIDISSHTGLPSYQIIWTQLARPGEKKGNLVKLSLLAERLNQRVEATAPSRIICRGLDPEYEAVVADVAANNGIDTNATAPVKLSDRLVRFVTAVIGILPFLIDQLFAMLWRKVSGLPEKTEVVFLPPVGRFDSTLPVLEEAEFDFKIVIFPNVLVKVIKSRNFAHLNRFNPVPLGLFASVSTLRNQLFILLGIYQDLISTNKIEKQISRLLYEETGLELDATIAAGTQNLVRGSLFRALAYYPLADQMINQLEPESVVVGGHTPIGKTVLCAAQDHRRHRYLLPHSVTTADEDCPRFGAVEFIDSEIGRQHLERQPHCVEAPQVIVTGRPYLEKVNNRTENVQSKKIADDEPVTILIATQPYPDEIRVALVNQVLDVRGKLNTEIIVKIHPSESKEFYVDRFNGIKTVTGSNLFDWIRSADIVVTVNSNVGIEAILANTPCICINFWNPFIRVPPYVSETSIPVLSTPGEVGRFFESLNSKKIMALGKEQQLEIEQNFLLDRTAERICSNIAEELNS